MAQTPDRKPGQLVEDDSIKLEDRGSSTGVVGTVYRVGSDLFAHDGIGAFNIRTGGSGLTEGSHRDLDQLVHGIAENAYEEITYTGARVDSIVIWTDSGKTQKIREELYTYSGNTLTQVVTKQYDGSGVLIVGETLTEDYNYTGNKVTSIDKVLS